MLRAAARGLGDQGLRRGPGAHRNIFGTKACGQPRCALSPEPGGALPSTPFPPLGPPKIRVKLRESQDKSDAALWLEERRAALAMALVPHCSKLDTAGAGDYTSCGCPALTAGSWDRTIDGARPER